MTAPSSWAVRKLLPLLEENLAPLLPVKVHVEETTEGAHLSWGDQPLARVLLEEDGFSPGELTRWHPAVLALAQELLHRLVREKLLEGLPGPQLLRRDLEREEKKGLLVGGLRPAAERIYALEKGLYFLPEGVIRPREFLLKNWAQEKPFVAVSVRLTTAEDLPLALDLFWLARAFGFSWLSGKAVKLLSRELDLEGPFEPVFRPVLEAFEKGAALLLAEGEEELLSVISDQAQKSIPLGKGKLLAALPLSLEEGLKLAQDLGLCAGIYAGGAELPPLAAVWAAFEHARRLPKPQPVTFSPFTYHVAGDFYLDLGDLGAAWRCYLAGKEGTAQPVDLLNSLAVIMIQLGRREEARKYLEEAIRRSPEDPLLRYNLGLFLREEGNPKAEKCFEEAFHLAPEETVFAEAWAEVLAARGDWSGVEKALSRVKVSPKGKFLLARAFYERGALKEAFTLFKEVAREEPQNAKALAYLALLFAQLEGEREVAESLAAEAERLDREGVRSLVLSLREFFKEGGY